MARFEDSIDYVLVNEGGYVANPNDPGGETNFGISKAVYPNVDVKNLTVDEAKAIYRKDYWRYDALDNQRVATKLFDAAVNLGAMHAVKLFQQSLGALQAGPVVADGIFGSLTAERANAANPEALVDEFKARLAVYYCSLDRPQFLLGWLRRAVRG